MTSQSASSFDSLALQRTWSYANLADRFARHKHENRLLKSEATMLRAAVSPIIICITKISLPPPPARAAAKSDAGQAGDRRNILGCMATVCITWTSYLTEADSRWCQGSRVIRWEVPRPERPRRSLKRHSQRRIAPLEASDHVRRIHYTPVIRRLRENVRPMQIPLGQCEG